jgi:phosphatidylglycerophosphate synthase
MEYRIVMRLYGYATEFIDTVLLRSDRGNAFKDVRYMLDPLLRPPVDRVMAVLARRSAAAGLTPNFVTIVGFAFGVGAMAALAFQAYGLALALLIINRVMDGLDGALARITGATDIGGYYDIVFDFIVYSGFVFAFAVGQPQHALAAAFLIFSFVGTGSSFLAFAIVAQKQGISTERRGRKAFYYLGGLTEGTETILVLIAICLFPSAFSHIAVVFGLMCWITTVTRILSARSTFG